MTQGRRNFISIWSRILLLITWVQHNSAWLYFLRGSIFINYYAISFGSFWMWCLIVTQISTVLVIFLLWSMNCFMQVKAQNYPNILVTAGLNGENKSPNHFGSWHCFWNTHIYASRAKILGLINNVLNKCLITVFFLVVI